MVQNDSHSSFLPAKKEEVIKLLKSKSAQLN